MRYSVAANTTTTERNATVNIATATHTVRQDAGLPTEVRLSGKVSNLSGSCPNLSFTINTIHVTTNASTRFDDGSCSGMKNGITVDVRGTRQASGSIVAKEVELDDDD
jgi:hypothetical protein